MITRMCFVYIGMMKNANRRVFELVQLCRVVFGLIVLATGFALGGCSQPKGVLFEPLESPLYWPQPPAEARIKYVGSLSTDKDLKPAKSFARSFTESIFGKDSSQGMLTPFAVCSDGNGRVFVCDSNAQVVHVFNIETRSYEQWAPDPVDGILSQPVGVVYDAMGRLLVSDSAGGVLHAFDSDSSYLGTLGEGVLVKPSGIVFDPDTNRIFVADVGAHQVVVLSFDGELIERVGQRGTKLGEFNFPTNVTMGNDGSLIVSDSLNFRIQVFNADLEPALQIGEKGDLPGYFSHPKGVAVDSDGHIYVIDSHFESVQIFDKEGNFLLNFGQEGHGPGQFWLPTGIHIDNNNHIWIADSYNQRLQVFKYLPEGQR